jgi:hypothetical protein
VHFQEFRKAANILVLHHLQQPEPVPERWKWQRRHLSARSIADPNSFRKNNSAPPALVVRYVFGLKFEAVKAYTVWPLEGKAVSIQTQHIQGDLDRYMLNIMH